MKQSSSPGVSAAELASLSPPDTLETPFGRMESFDGVPLPSAVAVSGDGPVGSNLRPWAQGVAVSRSGFLSPFLT